MKVAALYVETGGAYFGLPDVDPWDEARDARRYDGPWPVVAHPPCARWCMLASVNEARWGAKIGADGGCFAAALKAVRRYGGVLEHPAYSLAWSAFGLPAPIRFGWARSLWDEGYATEVSQAAYNHPARKRTWLYAVGVDLPALDWRDPDGEAVVGAGIHSGQSAGRPRIDGAVASATPEAFRAALLGIARTARIEASTYPEPPRDSGEADAVNGLTALGTHDGPATAGSSNAPRRLEATGSRAGDNTLERSNAGHDARS